MTRTRKDVWTATHDEGGWPAVLVGYERRSRCSDSQTRRLGRSPPTSPDRSREVRQRRRDDSRMRLSALPGIEGFREGRCAAPAWLPASR